MKTQNTVLINELRKLSVQASNYMDKRYYLLLMSIVERKAHMGEILSVVRSMFISNGIKEARGF